MQNTSHERIMIKPPLNYKKDKILLENSIFDIDGTLFEKFFQLLRYDLSHNGKTVLMALDSYKKLCEKEKNLDRLA